MKTQLETNIKLPFVNTAISTDIILLFALVPVWWLFGLDQVIWPIITSWIFIKLLFKGDILLTKITRLMLMLLLVSLISACFIVENYRILTFGRNFFAFASVWLLTVCLTNTIKNEKQMKNLLWGLAIVSFLASFLGLLAIMHIFSPRFEAPTKYLIPEGLKSFGLVRAIYSKGTSTLDYFAGRMVIRPNSFFIGCTTYGVALVILIPIAYFLFIKTRGLGRAFLLITLVLLLVNLAFNMSRGAILSLIIGTAIYCYKKFSPYKKFNILFLVLLGAFALYFQLYYSGGLENVTQSIINIRGAGSQQDRMIVYKATIQGVLERPLFGYGTQRDIPEISYYPIGSHSGYLGILYRYGIAGFSLYILTLLSIYEHTKIPKSAYLTSPFLARSIDFLSIAFYGSVFHQLVEEPDLDLIALHIVWLAFGLLIVAHKLLIIKQGQELCPVRSDSSLNTKVKL